MKTAHALAAVLATLGLFHCSEPDGAGGTTVPSGAPAPLGSTPPSSPAERPADRSAGLGDTGVWEGKGVAHEASGKELGPFTITMRRSPLGAKVRAEGTVTLADGTQTTFWQEMEEHGERGFSITSSSGAGGGRCFTNGMCQTYEARGSHAFATTLSSDGPGKLRVLVTELEQGKAVRFFEQTLLKKP